jgi:hypothetical protein
LQRRCCVQRKKNSTSSQRGRGRSTTCNKIIGSGHNGGRYSAPRWPGTNPGCSRLNAWADIVGRDYRLERTLIRLDFTGFCRHRAQRGKNFDVKHAYSFSQCLARKRTQGVKAHRRCWHRSTPMDEIAGGSSCVLLSGIAVEIVTTAEISYREGFLHAYEWLVQRKAQLEQDCASNNSNVSDRSATARKGSRRRASTAS